MKISGINIYTSTDSSPGLVFVHLSCAEHSFRSCSTEIADMLEELGLRESSSSTVKAQSLGDFVALLVVVVDVLVVVAVFFRNIKVICLENISFSCIITNKIDNLEIPWDSTMRDINGLFLYLQGRQRKD